MLDLSTDYLMESLETLEKFMALSLVYGSCDRLAEEKLCRVRDDARRIAYPSWWDPICNSARRYNSVTTEQLEKR